MITIRVFCSSTSQNLPNAIVQTPSGERIPCDIQGIAIVLSTHQSLSIAAPGYFRRKISPGGQTQLHVELDPMSERFPLWWIDEIGPYNCPQNDLPIKVGVIDSGCAEHPLLKRVDRYSVAFDGSRTINGSVVKNRPSFIAEPPRDSVGHGTHVIGSLCAKDDPDIPFSGAHPTVDVISIRLVDTEKSSDVLIGDKLASAIHMLLDARVDLINLSLEIALNRVEEGPDGDTEDEGQREIAPQSVRDAIEDAIDQGVVVVAASGNDGKKYLKFPASHPYVFAISAYGMVEQTPPHSYSYSFNRGVIALAQQRNCPYFPAAFSNFSRASFWAPGVTIISTFPGSRGPFPAFFPMDGTSMAAGIASGMISRILGDKANDIHLLTGANKLVVLRQILHQLSKERPDEGFGFPILRV